MRRISPTLSPELKNITGDTPPHLSPPVFVESYENLVAKVAKLSWYNKDYLLFFRGQSKDYLNKSRGSTFYPSIYRGDLVTENEIRIKFDTLQNASSDLRGLMRDSGLDGKADIMRKRYIAWSILQHYEVSPTPLLDFTHSLRVACSFAQVDNKSDEAFIFIFGLPYLTNRISTNSEHDIVNIRLLSICPPDALRPYYQEGYLAGTDDVTYDYDDKTELDFRNRLVAKFRIPNKASFWGAEIGAIPRDFLYPTNDKYLDICRHIKPRSSTLFGSNDVGRFISNWVEFENNLRDMCGKDNRYEPIVRTIDSLSGKIPVINDLKPSIDSLRKFRNILVHSPNNVDLSQLRKSISELERISSEIMRSQKAISPIGYRF